MQYRSDLKSGNVISILGFGCMRLPGTLGRIDYPKSKNLFQKAIDRGINYFDTAYLYPGSETALGRFLAETQQRSNVFLATKLPHAQCRSLADIEQFFQTQLERLQTDYIDYYLIHNISDYEQWEHLCSLGIEDWIAGKKKAGAIRQIGFSFHGPQQHFTRLLDQYSWDFCQIQYNYININYQAGRTGLRKAASMGLPVFIMEPLLGGKLALGLPAKAVQCLNQANPQYSPAAWALRWLWNQPEVTMVLSGMNQEDQLEDNLRAAAASTPGMFTETETQAIEEVIQIFNDSYKIPCTGCNYCMPCPKGINIPAAFSAYNTSYSIGRWSGTYHYMISSGALSNQPHFASSCADCGKCEKHCPQHIKIRSALADTSRRLELAPVKAGMTLYRKLSSR